jgi:parvulin-like peptidyl-prolyl isomerase
MTGAAGPVLANPAEAWRAVTLPPPPLLQELAANDLLDGWFQRQLLQQLAGALGTVACDADTLLAYGNRLGLPSLEALDLWREQRHLSLPQLETLATFADAVAQASETVWADQVPSLFLERRERYDSVTLSLVRVRDADLAMELFFQLQEHSLDFSEAVRRYGEEPDRRSRGLVGPVAVHNLHPVMAQVVRRHPPGTLIPPLDIGGMQHLVRVEAFEAAQLTEPIRQQLLGELRSRWLGEQLGHLRQRLAQATSDGRPVDPVPLGTPASQEAA